jgi:hypothetical protein
MGRTRTAPSRVCRNSAAVHPQCKSRTGSQQDHAVKLTPSELRAREDASRSSSQLRAFAHLVRCLHIRLSTNTWHDVQVRRGCDSFSSGDVPSALRDVRPVGPDCVVSGPDLIWTLNPATADNLAATIRRYSCGGLATAFFLGQLINHVVSLRDHSESDFSTLLTSAQSLVPAEYVVQS